MEGYIMNNKKVDKFTAAWMDKCHELELEIVELKQLLSAWKHKCRMFEEELKEKQ